MGAGPRNPRRHVLCAGTALPAAGSARVWAPSSATLSSSRTGSSRGGLLGGLHGGGGAMAERREPGRPAASRGVQRRRTPPGPGPATIRRASGPAPPARARDDPPQPRALEPPNPPPGPQTPNPPLDPRIPKTVPGPRTPTRPRAPRTPPRPHRGSGAPRQPRARFGKTCCVPHALRMRPGRTSPGSPIRSSRHGNPGTARASSLKGPRGLQDSVCLARHSPGQRAMEAVSGRNL